MLSKAPHVTRGTCGLARQTCRRCADARQTVLHDECRGGFEVDHSLEAWQGKKCHEILRCSTVTVKDVKVSTKAIVRKTDCSMQRRKA